jgi:hypothetical protein
VLGEGIERNLYELLETLVQAKYNRERTTLLDQANLKLEILCFQVWLAKDLQFLRSSSYEFASQNIEEIGRLVGGCPSESASAMFRPSSHVRLALFSSAKLSNDLAALAAPQARTPLLGPVLRTSSKNR